MALLSLGDVMSGAGQLYIVATPLGHLADISLRALQVLAEVDVIMAEDTRHSQRLLQHYQITTQLLSLHQHNERQRITGVVERLQQGQSIALISDAGTPLISDPGAKLVAEVRESGLAVVPVPGACALIAALSSSGLDTQGFTFLGFLPSKRGQRQQHLHAYARSPYTLVCYEAPHRIEATLQDMCVIFGEQRRACLARELTKQFETILTMPLAVLRQKVAEDPNQRKGEMVLLVEAEAAVAEISAEAEGLLRLLVKDLPLKKAAQITAQHYGLRPKPLYQLGLNLKAAE